MLTIDFVVSPAAAVKGVTKDSIKVLVHEAKVQTKAASYTAIPVASATVDETTGDVTITANISEKTPAEGNGLTVAVNIKNGGISDFTTEFVPVYVAPAPVVPEGFVDLGVKTSDGKPLYWAEKNLGASKPEDPGDYYMWGATALMYTAVDYSKTDGAFSFKTGNPYGSNYKNTWDANKGFVWNNAPFTAGVFKNPDNKKVFTKYTTSNVYANSNTPDNIKTLNPEDDAATAKNSSWRMPTEDDFLDLRANCVWIWTANYNDTGTGYIVYKAKNGDSGMAYYSGKWHKWNSTQSKYEDYTGQVSVYEPSDNHIFLPAAGCGVEAKLNNYNKGGCYWSSSLATSDDLAFALSIMSFGFVISGGQRQYGYSVRLVTDASATPAPTPTTTGTAKRTGDLDVNWVQLWENGPKFAEYNVGVTDGKAESYGGNYAWGGSQDKVDDHNTGSGNLTGADDTATNLWGSNWRMPTQAELQALLSSCDVEWMDGSTKKYNNTTVTGLLCTGKGAYASNSVFLPAAGYCDGGGVSGQDNYGLYWSSTPDDSYEAYLLDFNSGNQFVDSDDHRSYGFSVRAVLAD